jgi:deoxyribonuclease-4
MELEFVRRVSMRERKAQRVREASQKLGVSLSVHAPYYINLNSADPQIVRDSQERLFEAGRIGSLCGARSIAFHPGFYMGRPPSVTLGNVKKRLKEVLKRCADEGLDVQLRPETTGKPSQFGRLDEVLALSAELDGVLPCIDFAHMHAYSGRANSYDEFAEILDAIRSRLGARALADMHIHVSGIRFGNKGELEHLDLRESDLNYQDLLKALKDFSVGGRLICESPDREPDALLLKNLYQSF